MKSKLSERLRRVARIFWQVRDPLIDTYVGQHVQTRNDHPRGYVGRVHPKSNTYRRDG
jgi:hypothetical protein